MIVHDVEQYSPEWWELRRGVPTSSQFTKIITPKTVKLSTQSIDYRNKLIAEPITHEEEDTFEPTLWMQRGHELQSEALDLLAFLHDIEIDPIGFITNDAGTLGCSPDAGHKLNGRSAAHKKFGIEVKCPKGSTQVGYLLDGKLPDFYKPQVHGSLYITGLPKWLLMSYHPRFQPLIVEIKPDEYTTQIGQAIEQFAKQLADARMKIAE